MNVFAAIEQRIFSYAATMAPAGPPSIEPGGALPSDVPPEAPEPVDVDAVLSHMADARKQGDDWRGSIDALLRLLELDGPETRLSLRRELGGDAAADEDRVLLDAVMRKLGEDGAIVSLRPA